MKLLGTCNEIEYDAEYLSGIFEISSDCRMWTFNLEVSWKGQLLTNSFHINFTEKVLEDFQEYGNGEINFEFLRTLATQYGEIQQTEILRETIKTVILLYDGRKKVGLDFLLLHLITLKVISNSDNVHYNESLHTIGWDERDCQEHLENYIGRLFALSSSTFISKLETLGLTLSDISIEDTHYVEDDKFIQTVMNSAIMENPETDEAFFNILDSQGWELATIHSSFSSFLNENEEFINQDMSELRTSMLNFSKQIFVLISNPQITGLIELNDNIWLYDHKLYLDDGISYTAEQVELLILELIEKEEERFNNLRNKYKSSSSTTNEHLSRKAIPENVKSQVWRRDGGKCVQCGSNENLEFDHIIPFSKGGSSTYRNLQLLCQDCNRSKSDNIG